MRLLYTVFQYYEEARTTVKKLVEEKIISCAHIWEIKSICYFENSFKEKEETAVLLKIKSEQLDVARKRLREMHSYQVPAIIVIKPESVNNNYLKWIRDVLPDAPAEQS